MKTYKICKYCNKQFQAKNQEEYCSEICWCLAHKIDMPSSKHWKHYAGGHKNMKRKKK